MPGQIKIDDGSGNYTVLTNGGSLGSDKTITIPNETATLATTNASNLGGLVKLASATASASSELLFDNFVDTSTYSFYKLIMKDISPVTDNSQLRFAFRTGGASGSDLSGTYYRFNAYSNITTTAAENYTTATSTDFANVGNLGNLANETYTISSDLFTAEGTYGSSFIMNQGVYSDQSSDYYKIATTNAIDSVTAVTGMRWFLSSGNIASGTITIYGVKK